jgi:dihydrofolate reductase
MIAIIVAHTKNGRVIGNNGKIPWNIPGELDRFKF